MVSPLNWIVIIGVLWSTLATAKYRASCFGRNLVICAFCKCIYKHINRKRTLQISKLPILIPSLSYKKTRFPYTPQTKLNSSDLKGSLMMWCLHLAFHDTTPLHLSSVSQD